MTHADREQVKILTEKIDTMNVRMHSLSELCDGFYKDWGIALARVAELERQLAEKDDLIECFRITEATLNRALRSEVDLRNVVYVERVATAESRVATLEHALREYGNHTAECGLETERTGSPDYQCTCGFADVITGAVSTALAPPVAPDVAPQEDGT